jgi:hypothetical protein
LLAVASSLTFENMKIAAHYRLLIINVYEINH